MTSAPFTIEIGPLSPESQKIAEEELRETPENVKQALEELRELLKNDSTIYYRDDDEFLMIFLRPCKFYAKSAHEMMKRIAEFREKYKNLLGDLTPEDEKEAFTKYDVVSVMKNRDHKGRRVLIVNCGEKWDTSKVSSDQLFRLFYLVHLGAILEPETQVRGVVVIMDFKGMGMRQVMSLNPSFSMKLLGFIQDAMPLRLKEVHMINEPMIFNMVWKIFKPFIKEKLNSRMLFHGSKMAKLHKYMAPSHLPSNYGGELEAIDYTGADWYPTIEEHLDHIKKWNTYGLRK